MNSVAKAFFIGNAIIAAAIIYANWGEKSVPTSLYSHCHAIVADTGDYSYLKTCYKTAQSLSKSMLGR